MLGSSGARSRVEDEARPFEARDADAEMVAALLRREEMIAMLDRPVGFENGKRAEPAFAAAAIELRGITGGEQRLENARIGRHLRDALSARLMVANERLHATDASLLLIAKEA